MTWLADALMLGAVAFVLLAAFVGATEVLLWLRRRQ